MELESVVKNIKRAYTTLSGKSDSDITLVYTGGSAGQVNWK